MLRPLPGGLGRDPEKHCFCHFFFTLLQYYIGGNPLLSLYGIVPSGNLIFFPKDPISIIFDADGAHLSLKHLD